MIRRLSFYYLFAAVTLRFTVSVTDVTLLALVPWPDERPYADWDAGPDLLVSARIAVDEVNADPDVLPNHRLVLEERGHEACGLTGGNMGILNLVKYAIDPRTAGKNVLGVIGMFCSTSTKEISPVAGRDDIDFIQLSGANSPDFLKGGPGAYPHLWRFLESATVHADAMIAIMDRFNWKKVSMVVDLENSFLSGIGAKFTQTISQRKDLELVYHGSILQLFNVEDLIEGIINSEARIIFLSTTAPQAARIYCLAAKFNMQWPNYVWVLADYLSNVILQEADCSVDDLRRIMDGSLITYFSLEPDNPQSTVLVSNITYEQYKIKYNEELLNVRQDFLNITNDIPGEYLYGGIIYDQVWAFALAFNASLPELYEMNFTNLTYNFGHPEITAVLEKNLKALDFTGATGRVHFTENREVANTIKIFQVSNFTDLTVGTYDAHNPDNTNVNISNPPTDEIKTEFTLLPLPVTIVLGVIILTVIILITVNTILTLALRKRHHEIVAMSPKLSTLVFLGCYLECLAAILIILRISINLPELAFTVLCNAEIVLGLLGIYIILATNMFKLARIFRVFTYFGKTGRLWSDYSLALYVLFVCIFPCLMFVIWFTVDKLQYTLVKQYHTDVFPVYKEVQFRCNCQFYLVWIGILYGYVGFIICGLTFFAIQTRKIHRRSFKDTKKVNLFAFFTIGVASILVITEQILIVLKLYIYASVALSLMFLSTCLICQLFLFSPKTFPSLLQTLKTKSANLSSVAHERKLSELPNEPHTFTKSIRNSSTALIKQVSTIKFT